MVSQNLNDGSKVYSSASTCNGNMCMGFASHGVNDRECFATLFYPVTTKWDSAMPFLLQMRMHSQQQS